MTYKIIKVWHPDTGKRPRVIMSGITLEVALKWCNDPDTSTDNYFYAFDRETDND